MKINFKLFCEATFITIRMPNVMKMDNKIFAGPIESTIVKVYLVLRYYYSEYLSTSCYQHIFIQVIDQAIKLDFLYRIKFDKNLMMHLSFSLKRMKIVKVSFKRIKSDD